MHVNVLVLVSKMSDGRLCLVLQLRKQVSYSRKSWSGDWNWVPRYSYSRESCLGYWNWVLLQSQVMVRRLELGTLTVVSHGQEIGTGYSYSRESWSGDWNWVLLQS